MTGWTLFALLIAAIAAYLLFSGFLRIWRIYRGLRVLTCPENLQPAAVKVAAFDAAKWFAVSGQPDLHLRSCSRWPEMAGCGEECLTQVAAHPHDCLVTTIVARWYEGKSCHFCGDAIGTIVWHERPPAVRLGTSGTTKEWKEIAPEQLPNVFATGTPVCWPCHLVETFRRENPRLVVERKRLVPVEPLLQPSVAIY